MRAWPQDLSFLPVVAQDLPQALSHEIHLVLTHIGENGKADELGIQGCRAGEIFGPIPERVTIVRMQMQWHPVDACSNATLLEFVNDCSAIDTELIQSKPDRVEMPRMNP